MCRNLFVFAILVALFAILSAEGCQPEAMVKLSGSFPPEYWIQGGQQMAWSLYINNTGDISLSNCIGTFISDFPDLNGQQVYIESVIPGDAETAGIMYTIPTGFPAWPYATHLEVFCDSSTAPFISTSNEVIYYLSGKPHVEMAFIADPPSGSTVTSESEIDFTVWIRNDSYFKFTAPYLILPLNENLEVVYISAFCLIYNGAANCDISPLINAGKGDYTFYLGLKAKVKGNTPPATHIETTAYFNSMELYMDSNAVFHDVVMP